MAWWKPWDRAPRSTELVVARPQSVTALALTAAAQVVSSPSVGARRVVPRYATWQDELWDYYETLGEFNIAVTWRSYMMSRVRLRAARLKPGSDEPEIVDSGPAADLVNELFADASTQSEMLGNISVMMDVPAECWLVGEVSTAGGKPRNKWRVVSSDELRRRGHGYEVISEDSMVGDERWRELGSDSYVTRVWKPHKRKRYLPYSQAYAARGAMRELELVNRHITAQYLSRLASAGVIIFPDEIVFPVRPEFQDEPDPFLREWIEIAAESIKTPGSAAAMIPMPIRMPSDLVDKVKHIDFTVKIDDNIIEKRDSARNRLAGQINVPAELLFQAADVNHWCVDTLTQIYTRDRGWVSHDELHVGDVVRALDPATGLACWEPVLNIARFDVTDLEMIRLASKFHDSLTTLDHRWFVERDGERVWTKSRDLNASDRVIRSALSSELPEFAKYTDAFVKVLAWFITEGTLTRTPRTGKPHQIRIGQSHRVNPEYVDAIRHALTGWLGASSNMRSEQPTWREEIHDSTGITVFVLNRHARDEVVALLDDPFRKVMSRDVIHALTESQLALFVTTFAQGDGQTLLGGYALQQRDSERLAVVELASVLLGYPVQTRTLQSNGFKSGEMTNLGVQVSWDSTHDYSRPYVGSNVMREWYTGVVWCPVTPSTTWLARRNGKSFFTGNSLWQLEEGAVRTYISPDAEIIVGALTRGYLQPRLRTLGEDDWEEWVVWYDTSELMVHPDKAANATEAYDRMEINGKSFRREMGFDEDDAPSDNELASIILRKLISQPNNALLALNELTGIKLEQPAPAAPSGFGDDLNADPNAEPEDDSEDDDGAEKTGAQELGPPKTGNNRPPTPGQNAIAKLVFSEWSAFARLQAQSQHIFEVDVLGRWELKHPLICEPKLFSCPFTHVTHPGVPVYPGRPGTYTCHLSSDGELRIGDRITTGNGSYISTAREGSLNGTRHGS